MLVDHGNRKYIVDGDDVQDPIVDAEAPCTIIFTHKEHKRGEQTMARVNDTFSQHLGHQSRYRLHLEVRVLIGFDIYWSSS